MDNEVADAADLNVATGEVAELDEGFVLSRGIEAPENRPHSGNGGVNFPVVSGGELVGLDGAEVTQSDVVWDSYG